MIIRDDGSFSGEKPLILVDGKVVAEINAVSPDRIASIDVLKGEGAFKLYGSEGKNGVIIITTKGSKLDTIPSGNKQISKTVIINTTQKSDGSQDTTIIQSDSIAINGMPFEEFRDRSGKNVEVRIVKMAPDAEGREIRIENMKSEIVLDKAQPPLIVRGFELPGSPVEAPREFELALPRGSSEGGETKNVYLFKGDLSSPAEKPTPKIGLSVQDTEDGKGVEVTGVTAKGAAAKAGIKLNDRVLRFDEIATNEVNALQMALEMSRDKRSVMVHLQRGGKDIRVELVFTRQLKQADL